MMLLFLLTEMGIIVFAPTQLIIDKVIAIHQPPGNCTMYAMVGDQLLGNGRRLMGVVFVFFLFGSTVQFCKTFICFCNSSLLFVH